VARVTVFEALLRLGYVISFLGAAFAGRKVLR
jgi:hypothetical protein